MTAAGPELVFGEKTWLMGIINVTPDSFSGDGLAAPGRSKDEIVSAAVDQARAFVRAGAEILDVGAESTRPASVYGDRPPVNPETEAALAVPVAPAAPAVPAASNGAGGANAGFKASTVWLPSSRTTVN